MGAKTMNMFHFKYESQIVGVVVNIAKAKAN